MVPFGFCIISVGIRSMCVVGILAGLTWFSDMRYQIEGGGMGMNVTDKIHLLDGSLWEFAAFLLGNKHVYVVGAPASLTRFRDMISKIEVGC